MITPPRAVLAQLFLLITVSCLGQVRGQQQPVEVPFEFFHNEIIVQVKVDGKGPFNMMLDTGTDPSAVDLTTAKELGLKLSSAGGPVSGGGSDGQQRRSG